MNIELVVRIIFESSDGYCSGNECQYTKKVEYVKLTKYIVDFATGKKIICQPLDDVVALFSEGLKTLERINRGKLYEGSYECSLDEESKALHEKIEPLSVFFEPAHERVCQEDKIKITRAIRPESDLRPTNIEYPVQLRTNSYPHLVDACMLLPDEKFIYPGIPAKFAYYRGCCEPCEASVSPPNIELRFRSKNYNSLLCYFELYRRRGGELTIGITFTKRYYDAESDEFMDIVRYFAQHNITIDTVCLPFQYYYTSGSTELRKMFNILAKNNEIPADYFNVIRNIIGEN